MQNQVQERVAGQGAFFHSNKIAYFLKKVPDRVSFQK